MKKKKIIKWVLIVTASILAIPLLIMLYILILFSGIFLPDPPMPDIKYAEFPFRIEIEHDGERLLFEDTIICEYDGVGVTEYGTRKYRMWKSRFASGREYTASWPSIEMLNTDYVVLRFHSGEPAFYMDRSWMELEHGIPYSPARPSIYVDDKAMRARGEFSFQFYGLPWGEERLRETLANFGIEIISIELPSPIENTFH